MTATAAGITTSSCRTRTGGPDDGPGLLEHVLGRTLGVVPAVFVTRAGLM